MRRGHPGLPKTLKKGGTHLLSDEDQAVLDDIEETILKDLQLGFDPRVLEILDNDKASYETIDQIKDMVSKQIVAKLFQLGGSFHYFKLRIGNVSNFYDLIVRLGMQPTKIFILLLSLFSVKNSDAFRMLCARSFATSILAKLFAQERKWKDELVNNIELMGLFVEVGKVILLLYREHMTKMYGETECLSEEFVERYHPYFGAKLVKQFNLPDYLLDTLSHPDYLCFDEDSTTEASVVYSAFCIVDLSFRKHGKLIIQSPMPDTTNTFSDTAGVTIQSWFSAIGLSDYLEIRPVPEKDPAESGIPV